MKKIEGLTDGQNAQLRLMVRMAQAIQENAEELRQPDENLITTHILAGISGMIGFQSNDETHNKIIANGALFRIYDEVMALIGQRVEAAIFEASPIDMIKREADPES